MGLPFEPLGVRAEGEKNNVPTEPTDHALGRSRGGYGTKFHLLCDEQGHPLGFVLSAGQVHDNQLLAPLLDVVDQSLHSEDGQVMPWPHSLAGDKGYRALWIDEHLLERGICPIIPCKKNQDKNKRLVPFDKVKYKKRSIIENLIGWLKESRRIATRFEKTATNFAAMVKLACIHRYLRLATR